MMDNIADLKAELKKRSARATQAKMDLHDLAEDLPLNWQEINLVADRAQRAYADLTATRAALKAAEEKAEG